MKTPKNGFFRDCRRLIALVQCKHPATLPAALFTAVLESAFPFVNIIFGALILDRLLTSDEGVMVLVWWMIGLDFALGCSSRVLRWLCRAEALTADELALGAMTEKCMTMDYQQLETQEIMDKKARAEEGCTSRGSFFEFVWNLSELLCHGLTILYALITVSRLFVSVPLPADGNVWARTLNSPWLALAAVTLSLAAPLACVPLTKWANRVNLEWYNINIHNKNDTFTVEGVNADLRHYIPTLARRSRCFPRKLENLQDVLAVFVRAYNRFGFQKHRYRSRHPGSSVPFSLFDFL